MFSIVRKILERAELAEALGNMPVVEIVTAGLSDFRTSRGECAGPYHCHMAVS
jgi:hypothetical protein